MTLRNVLTAIVLLVTVNSFAQIDVTTINTKEGIRYITPTATFPITGTYLFNGAAPVVELNGDGTGYYQLHEQPKRAVLWGIECSETGEPLFIKGFDSAAYSLWYHYTVDPALEMNEEWNRVPFSIHFSTLKMYIQGERVKDFTGTPEK
jgi:hypothetical protein